MSDGDTAPQFLKSLAAASQDPSRLVSTSGSRGGARSMLATTSSSSNVAGQGISPQQETTVLKSIVDAFNIQATSVDAPPLGCEVQDDVGHNSQPLPANAHTVELLTPRLIGQPNAFAVSQSARSSPRIPAQAPASPEDPMAFFEAHKLYYLSELGRLPDLSAAMAGGSDGLVDNQEGSVIVSGSLDRSSTPPPAPAQSPSMSSDEAIRAIQMLSATTMPPHQSSPDFDVSSIGGPRSATSRLLKAPGPLPPQPPVRYPYNGPESLFGPYFEPLAWLASGQLVASLSAAGMAGTPRNIGSRGRLTAGGQQGSTLHQRLAAAGSGSTTHSPRLHSGTGNGAAVNTSPPFKTLIEACEAVRGGIGRNWSAEWRALLGMNGDTLRMAGCRMMLLDRMANEFGAYVAPIAQAIIEERRLPYGSAARTHKHLDGFPNVFIAKGLIFAVASTPSRCALYGSAEAANKAASNELRAQRVIRGSPHITSVFTPLCCIVSTLGHKVFVSAPMPIRSTQDIVYGTYPSGAESVKRATLNHAGANAHSTVPPALSTETLLGTNVPPLPLNTPDHFTTTNFAAMYAYEMAELFNLGQHKVPLSAADSFGSGSEKAESPLSAKTQSPSSPVTSASLQQHLPSITLPADAKLVYSVVDGATWLLDAARMAPSAACAYSSSKTAQKDDTTGKSLIRHPSENNYNAHLSVLFRPEFLRTYAVGSTNADAGLRCQPKSEQEHLSFMIHSLYLTYIPAAMAELFALEAKGALLVENIVPILHSHGVNARYMGKIYTDCENSLSKSQDVRNGVRTKLAMEMAARTFKALLVARLTAADLFTKEQLLNRTSTASSRMANNSHGANFNPTADEEEITIGLTQKFLLCVDGSMEDFWDTQMQPMMERKFGVYACPAKVAAEVVEKAEDMVSDGSYLKVYHTLGTNGKRRVEKPKATIHWTDYPDGRSVMDVELTQQVQKARNKTILYPLLGPNALENISLLSRVEQLAKFEISADVRGKRLVCAFSNKVSPCTALQFSQTVSALIKGATAELPEVLSQSEDPSDLRTAVEAAARSDLAAYHKIAEADSRAILSVALLAKSLAHRGQAFPATLVNRLQDIRKLVPSELINILTYFEMGGLLMLTGRYDRAETALATGLQRVLQFVSPLASMMGTGPLAGLLGLAATNTSTAAATTNGADADTSAALSATVTPSTAAASSIAAGKSGPIRDLHPCGYLDILAFVSRCMAIITLAEGRRPPTERARLVLDYYHYALYLAETTKHRLVPALVFEIANYRRCCAALPRDLSSEDRHHPDFEGTVGSRGTHGLGATRRGRATPSTTSKRVGAVAALQAAADRNRRATSLGEDPEGNEENETFVRKSAPPIEGIILPRDKAIYDANYSSFPSRLAGDATSPYEFVMQLALYQGLQQGNSVVTMNTTMASAASGGLGVTAITLATTPNTYNATATITSPILSSNKDKQEGAGGNKKKTFAPPSTFNASVALPVASTNLFENAIINANTVLHPRQLPAELRPLYWRAAQLVSALPTVRAASDPILGAAWLEIGAIDRDSVLIEQGIEGLTMLYGAASKQVMQAELRLVDVLFDNAKTICPYTGNEGAEMGVLAEAERQLKATLAKILSIPNCAETFKFELYMTISRFGRLIDVYSKLPTAKSEDAARRYLTQVLPTTIGPAHPFMTDIYDTLRTHYMYLGEARDEAASRSNAIITAGNYGLQWLECVSAIKGSESKIAQQLDIACEKIVKPLRGGSAHERQAAWSFFMRCNAIIHDAPFDLDKDPKVKEALGRIDGAFRSQHRIIVQSEKKALLQRQITEYAKEMHQAVHRVKIHKNRMDHYCEVQMRTIEGIGVAIKGLIAGVWDDDILLRAQDALEYHDEALRINNQMIRARALESDYQREGEGKEEEEGGDNEEKAAAENEATDDANSTLKPKAAGDGARRAIAKAYISPYTCLSAPDDNAPSRSVARRRSAEQSGLSLQRSRSNLRAGSPNGSSPGRSGPLMTAGPAPSSPGGFLPQLHLTDSANQQAARLINKVNQSLVSKNHNPVRTL